MHRPDIVRSNVYLCLHGPALEWFTYELTEAGRQFLRTLDLKSGWFLKLAKRFASRTSEARTALDSLYFSKEDAMDGRYVYTFAHSAAMRESSSDRV